MGSTARPSHRWRWTKARRRRRCRSGIPITQKRLSDALIFRTARSRGLIRALTDNGAGGLSSSIGEMAEETGGAEIWLDQRAAEVPGPEPLGDLDFRSAGAHEPRGSSRRTCKPSSTTSPRRGVEATEIGQFHRQRNAGRDLGTTGRPWRLDMAFLHEAPRLSLAGRGRSAFGARHACERAGIARCGRVPDGLDGRSRTCGGARR